MARTLRPARPTLPVGTPIRPALYRLGSLFFSVDIDSIQNSRCSAKTVEQTLNQLQTMTKFLRFASTINKRWVPKLHQRSLKSDFLRRTESSKSIQLNSL